MTTAGFQRGVLEALVGARAVAHVLLAKALDMLFDVVGVLPRG